MEYLALTLYTDALRDAALIALPIVGVVAAIGVVVGIIQTIVQVQDQNVAFAPKLAAVAMMIAVGGPAALELLRTLLISIVRVLPRLAQS